MPAFFFKKGWAWEKEGGGGAGWVLMTISLDSILAGGTTLAGPFPPRILRGCGTTGAV